MGVGSALRGFFGLVWRILEGMRKVLHLVAAAGHFRVRSRGAAYLHSDRAAQRGPGDRARGRTGRAAVERSGAPRPRPGLRRPGSRDPARDVTDAIAAAKTDSRIKLIVLDLDNLDPSGLSKLQEIGAALRDFRAAGKRVVAAADSLDQTQYYLAAQAGEVYLDPHGRGVCRRLQLLPHVLQGRHRQARRRRRTCSAPAPSRATPINSRAATWRRASARRAAVWLEALWNAYSQDVTRARSLPAERAERFHRRRSPRRSPAVNGDAAKLALQRGLVTALKSRRQVADDLKGLVGEDDDNHSFNAIGMSQYLAAVRSKRVLEIQIRCQGRHRGRRRRDSRRPSAAGQDRRREHRGPAAPGALRQRGESRGAARRQSGRQHVRLRADSSRGAGAAQGGQARGGVHEHLCRIGRLLHLRGREPNFRQSRRR